MSHTLIVRILVAAALASACSGPHAGSHSGAKLSNDAAVNASNASNSSTAAGDVALPPLPQLPHDSISDRADAGRITGDPKATLWVVMASDFQCPFCKEWHDAAFQKLIKNYVVTGRVRLAFLNVPLSIHPNAVPAAEAAMCASVQDKFWPMHEALFASQTKWEVMKNPVPMYDSIATSLRIDMPAWRQCVSQHLTLSLIQADHDRATKSGVASTPSFFVGAQALSGANADVSGAIDAALAKTGKKPTH